MEGTSYFIRTSFIFLVVLWGGAGYQGGGFFRKKYSHLLYFNVSRLPGFYPEKMAGTSKLIGLEIFLVEERGWWGVRVGVTLSKKISSHLLYLGVSRLPDAILKRWQALQI